MAMKGFLYSQDGSFAFPLGPKVTTIGRENCDISINSPHVDGQHALMEYDDDSRCFILKDLNSTTGTYVHDCRVQNAAVRLADGDTIRFGYNGLPMEFRIEQDTTSTMPSIYQRQSNGNSLQMITQTIPARRATSGVPSTTSNTIDALNPVVNGTNYKQNAGFSLRNRPSSAGGSQGQKKTLNGGFISNGVRDSVSQPPVRANAWVNGMNTNTQQNGLSTRSYVSGSFNGELDISQQNDNEITNRVTQLEKEVKVRDMEIRDLTDRLRNLEPISSTFTNEVHVMKTELDKVKREKQAASGLVSSLQRDLHSKESSLTKLSREVDALKTDSRDKDLRLQSLQAKLNLLRDRGRSEEDRYTKEKELVNLRNKMKSAENQVQELNDAVNRLKSQLQDTEKQLLRYNQNEQKLKQEYEQTRAQLIETQRSENILRTDLEDVQRKVCLYLVTMNINPFMLNDQHLRNFTELLSSGVYK
ncbi:unnamed protein product [Didymodactylos carnosus]|uniref:FHA domain-containing protein n=1 Tax=Didymodactylos carnosus TaxID=1234261 RepID=A0A814BKH5_9BILA|nr:unnamed protein product [Didymodactylos carnosus]CAF0927858.1 unnamed protein product [Didymodactylos carnosus]CAF3619389.1 unnamed protein product [Didymodactylos carnosus]CAF3706254.1 unnamed protein product [Didymodactylos carnosus]